MQVVDWVIVVLMAIGIGAALFAPDVCFLWTLGGRFFTIAAVTALITWLIISHA